MERKTQTGYLVLADISGYTSYVAQTEIEHADMALSYLLETSLPTSLNCIANASGSSPVTDKSTRCVLEHPLLTPSSVYSWSGSLLSCSIFTFLCTTICPLRSNNLSNSQNIFVILAPLGALAQSCD